jgi:hypothetical protein
LPRSTNRRISTPSWPPTPAANGPAATKTGGSGVTQMRTDDLSSNGQTDGDR